MTLEISDAKAIHETHPGKSDEGALLVEAPEFDEATWVPKSQIEEESEVYKKGNTGTLIVSDWIAKEKGWD